MSGLLAKAKKLEAQLMATTMKHELIIVESQEQELKELEARGMDAHLHLCVLRLYATQ